jgi:ankyrin repeat protein
MMTLSREAVDECKNAVIQNDVQELRRYIKSGFSEELLHIACQKGSVECAKLLIDSGALVNSRCEEFGGQTPLMTAASRGYQKFIRFLLLKGAIPNISSPGGTALHFAARYDQNSCINILVDGGADVNAVDSEGNTPLMIAAQTGKLAVVKLLLERNADTAYTNAAGETAADLSSTIELRLLIKNNEENSIRNYVCK